MSFFKKYSTAWIITAILIALSVLISVFKLPSQSDAVLDNSNADIEYKPDSVTDASKWAEENGSSYIRFVVDDADMLAKSTEVILSKYMAQTDYCYKSIMVLITVDGLNGKEIEDAAYSLGDSVGAGENDFVILLDKSTEEWYVAFGDQMGNYADNDAKAIFTQSLSTVFDNADNCLATLYKQMLPWYESNLPQISQQTDIVSVQQNATPENRNNTVWILIAVIIAVCIISRSSNKRKYNSYQANTYRYSRNRGSGFFNGLLIGSLLGRARKYNSPPPFSNNRSRTTFRSTSNRNSGVHSTGTRGGFGNGSRGGFGNSSRGAFGNRRH